MPPKKKGKITSPIVVGTVSTRSTRRQSVVNIEIPKSKPRNRKGFSGSLKSDEGSPLTILNSEESLYEKLLFKKNSFSEDPKMVQNISLPKNEFEVPPSVQSYDAQSLKHVSIKPHTITQSNKALLEILEDWSDGESQDVQKGIPNVSSSNNDTTDNTDFKNLEFGAEDINKIIDEDYTLRRSVEHEQSVTSEQDIREIEQQLTSDRDEFHDARMVNKAENNCNITDKTTTDSRVHGSIEEAITYENEVIFECVAEEIVPGPLDETAPLTKSEDFQERKETQVVSVIPSPCLETNIIDQEQTMPEHVNEETRQSISTSDSTDSEVRNFFAREIEKNECVKEKHIPSFEKKGSEITSISQSVVNSLNSTQTFDDSEHCDKLLQKQHIQDNIVHVEQPVIDHKLKPTEGDEMITVKDTAKTESSVINEEIQEVEEFVQAEEIIGSNEEEEMVVEDIIEAQEIEIGGEKEIETLEVVESQDLVEKSPECEESIELKNETLNVANETYMEISKLHDLEQVEDENKMEVTIENDDQSDKTCMGKKEDNFLLQDTFIETKDTELEEKVAELNITDNENLLEKDITDKVAELNLQISDEIQENKKLDTTDKEMSPKKIPKTARSLKTKNTELKVISKNRKTKIQKTIISKPTKTLKTTGKNLKERKPTKAKTKEPRDIKLRDKKVSPKPAKESKIKKKSTPTSPNKKGKEILDKKPTEIADQKEKKVVKTESDKEKTETDSEDLEVRRSSRIKSISILKKKTTGHGLVRSKSEPQLNESDTSDNNSIITESEKGTPSASPKIAVRERKTRWSKSTENISLVSPTIITSAPAHELSLPIDEKPKLLNKDPVVEARLKQFVHLKENLYKTDRMVCKEAKIMMCDCFLTAEEISSNEYGCGEDCLNRLLLIEW